MTSTSSIRSAALHKDLLPSLAAATQLECKTILDEILTAGYIQAHNGNSGPFDVVFSLQDNRFEIALFRPESDTALIAASVSLLPLRSMIRDYITLCESYQLVSEFTPYRIEAIDMGRRSLHDEGAEMVVEAVRPQATIDLETARRFFSLIVVLSRRMAQTL